jgi:hypothetical protein
MDGKLTGPRKQSLRCWVLCGDPLDSLEFDHLTARRARFCRTSLALPPWYGGPELRTALRINEAHFSFG